MYSYSQASTRPYRNVIRMSMLQGICPDVEHRPTLINCRGKYRMARFIVFFFYFVVNVSYIVDVNRPRRKIKFKDGTLFGSGGHRSHPERLATAIVTILKPQMGKTLGAILTLFATWYRIF